MNTVRLRLKSFSLLVVKCCALPTAAASPVFTHCRSTFQRTVLQLYRVMATTSANNKHNTESGQGKEAQQKEPLRRVKIKENMKRRYMACGPSNVYVQVVGAGSRDNAASLFVFSEFNRYLFNCGEGTQRLMQEHRLKMSHLDNVFITRLSWQNVGGLSGLILTLKDIGVPECVFCGPPQLENYLSAIKGFSGSLDDIKLLVRPYTGGMYNDDTMTVLQVPIFTKKTQLSPSQTSGIPDSPRLEESQNDNCEPDSSGEKPKPIRDTLLTVAFICKLHPKKGHFLTMRAQDLGLPVGTSEIGPLITALKNGDSVMYEGKEIRPEQVCTPTEPGPIFIVVDCPSEAFVQPVCTNHQLRRYQTGGDEDPPALVVHMTPESVLNLDQYKDWMERFPSTTQHLILNENVVTVHNMRSYKAQTQLNMIHPRIFPQLRSYRSKERQAALQVPNVRAECLLKFQLRPVMEWQRDAVPSYNADEFVQEASEVPNFIEQVEKCRKACSIDAAETSEPTDRYPEVVFLGTGSALPMKFRNVSGTLVNISPSQSLMLDCGEGTFGQLCRHYGDDVDEALAKMSTVFISHMHADHHTGLIELLYQRERALSTLGKPFSQVYLVGPRRLFRWLMDYDYTCEDIIHHVNFIPNRVLCDDFNVTKLSTKSFIEALLKNNNLDQFQTCFVHHCRDAFACSFTHQSGWKMAFSGDTMPCDAFVQIGKDSTLLIHEATLEDDLEEEAFEKKHSTTSQAIGIGIKMNADFIMLNHFSQRYAKIPLFSNAFTERVGISFDHMKIHFGDFEILPRITAVLKTLFAEFITELEDEKWRRELKNSKVVDVNETAANKRDQEAAAMHNEQAKRLKRS